MHRSIDCSTWDDPWFADLGPNAKLIFLYLITNRRVSQCGAMEITVRQISFETGMAAAEIPSAIESMGDRIQWWPGSNLLIVRNFYRHQRANTGDKFDIAARKSAETLPDFAREWLYGVYPHLRPEGDTHPIPTPVPPSTHAISEAVAGSEAGVKPPSSPLGEPPPDLDDSRGRRIPDDFAVDDGMRTWAGSKGFSPPEIEHFTEAFTTYWRGESGARSRKKDWRQAWQTWLLRETPGKWKPAMVAANGLPPEIARLPWNNATRMKWEQEHRSA